MTEIGLGQAEDRSDVIKPVPFFLHVFRVDNLTKSNLSFLQIGEMHPLNTPLKRYHFGEGRTTGKKVDLKRGIPTPLDRHRKIICKISHFQAHKVQNDE